MSRKCHLIIQDPRGKRRREGNFPASGAVTICYPFSEKALSHTCIKSSTSRPHLYFGQLFTQPLTAAGSPHPGSCKRYGHKRVRGIRLQFSLLLLKRPQREEPKEAGPQACTLDLPFISVNLPTFSAAIFNFKFWQIGQPTFSLWARWNKESIDKASLKYANWSRWWWKFSHKWTFSGECYQEGPKWPQVDNL